MSARKELNLDTSVLLNYVYSCLPGDIEPDKGCQRLIDSSDCFCVIGPKANGEFDGACSRRFELYDDLLDWLTANPEKSIYEYDPTKRDVRTSSNDLEHIRYDVQHGWAEESRQKQLSDIRRCQQEIGGFHEQLPEELIDRVYEELSSNDPLLEALDGLDLAHDKEIIVDAVEICRSDAISYLVAVDSDITGPDQIDRINQVIRDLEGKALCLEISRPDDV